MSHEEQNLAAQNQRLGQIEALQWAYEVSMTYGDTLGAIEIKKMIEEVRNCTYPDFPYLAGKLHKER